MTVSHEGSRGHEPSRDHSPDVGNMIERVARAISPHVFDGMPRGPGQASAQEYARLRARRAIEAMMAPARAPLTELRHHLKDTPANLWDDHLQHWLRELDAALTPPLPESQSADGERTGNSG